ncbi:MAG: hypothetical protein J6I53_10725 [Treponema sp.]|nr:hypothetical protein [Treponema sp.]
MMKKNIFLFVLFSLIFFSCQNATDDGGTTYVTNTIAFTWKGSLTSAPNNPELGWAYYNMTKKASYYWNGSSWQLMVQDGSAGVGISWKGELSTAPDNPQLNWAYYNRVDGNSYIWNGAKWDYLAKSGRDGASGIMLWLGAFDSVPENPSEGYCYYNTVDCTSYIWDGDSWEIIAKDGVDITWKGACEIAPDNPSLNWAYYNTVDNKSYIWNGSQWEILSESIGGNTNVHVSISWLGTFSSAPLNPVLGQAYYNESVGASYIYDGTVWQQISKDGVDGTVGSTSTVSGYLILWKGSYSSAPSNPQAGWAYYNTTAKKSYIYDGSSWQIMAQDGADGTSGTNTSSSGTDDTLVYMGESSEEIDSIIYTVKSYASVYASEPYFYTYYKYYYLNGKLRRVYVFYHSIGSALDYKYTEFVEHTCGNSSGLAQVYTYYVNGKIEFYIQNSNSNGSVYKYEYFYDSDGNKNYQKLYQDGNLYNEIYYYTNGTTKIQRSYNTSTLPYQLQSEKYNYSDGTTQLYISYNSDFTIDHFEYHYTSGYTQYYYTDSGYLYSYEDGKTTSTPTTSSYYSSKTDYTAEQADSKLAELKSSL